MAVANTAESGTGSIDSSDNGNDGPGDGHIVEGAKAPYKKSKGKAETVYQFVRGHLIPKKFES